MSFDPTAYGPEVASVLSMDGNGERLIPLVARRSAPADLVSELGKHNSRTLFKTSAMPEAAMSGLWLYHSCFEEAHNIAQDISSVEGSLWHGILHRQEPDSGNAAYWFRRAGNHPVFAQLVKAASEVVARYPEAEFRPSVKWDPFGFILFCERARDMPGSYSEAAALEIQRAEWQLLFDYCARTKA